MGNGKRRATRERTLPLREILRLFDGTADGVFAVDSEQRVLYWNDVAEELLGCDRDEVIGRQCFDIVAGGDYEGHPFCRPGCPVIAAARRGQPTPNYDVLARPGRDSPLWVNISIVVVEASDYPEPVAIHLFRDVSQRRKAEILASQTLAAVSQFSPRGENAEEPPHRPYPVPVPRLTPREIEVLRLLASGANVREIAEQLVLSQITVRNHIDNLMGKLGVHTRLQAVVFAARYDLL